MKMLILRKLCLSSVGDQSRIKSINILVLGGPFGCYPTLLDLILPLQGAILRWTKAMVP